MGSVQATPVPNSTEGGVESSKLEDEDEQLSKDGEAVEQLLQLMGIDTRVSREEMFEKVRKKIEELKEGKQRQAEKRVPKDDCPNAWDTFDISKV
ncbi:hypothetical protein RIF29_39087 [Crotalaria pallida]|uniref:Uncharacterized protein n=1 Tax=Crotalaria pallida TaxID=3830 RepID=A0AAN9E3K0_CROPI